MKIYDIEKNKKDIERIKKRSSIDLDEIIEKIKPLIEDVKRRGDKAIRERYAEKFDNVDLKSIKVTEEEKKEAYKKVSKKEIKAIKNATKNIQKFCELEMPKSWLQNISDGITAGQLVKSLERVGCYVPAGRFPLPSSVLMTVIPAKVAGVKEIYICTPTNENGLANESVVVAADIIGVKDIFKIGGSQAIAAFAYGTETVPKVDKIVGPGGIYTTAAKKLLYGDVGIDFLAGPSEILIIADESANPRFVAADMLAQAEHDIVASALLVTPSRKLGEKVLVEIKKQLSTLSTAEIARESLEKYGGVVLVKNLDEAFEFSNNFAPEHLEIMINDFSLLEKVKNAGAIFLGEWSIEVAGDYASGPNHVLPTGGFAKIRAGLSVRDFLKMPTVQILTKDGLRSIKDTVVTLAELESLDAHANSMKVRFEGEEDGKS